jgi:predicted MFS family arabinose efflux permease
MNTGESDVPEQPHNPALPVVQGGLARRMFCIFALAYVVSYGMRTINAVIAPDLIADLQLSASQLGLLASAYFLTFALMQLPVGLLLDRFGPRRVDALLMLITASGSLLFAYADSFALLWLGRALIGVGVSACLMAAVQAYALYFKPHLQGSMSSWMLTAGSVGALLVTTPVHYALPVLGWRGVFVVVAVVCMVASAALWWGLPRLPFPGKGTPLAQLLPGYMTIFRSAHFWRVVPLATFVQGGFMAFSGLWMGPWLQKVQGMDAAQTAGALFWFSLCLMLGYLLTGVLARRLSLRGRGVAPLIVVGVGSSFALLFAQVLTEGGLGMWGWMLWAFLCSGSIVTYSWCNEPFPKTLAGRSSTALNLFIFLGAFGVQWGIGIGVDAYVAGGLSQPAALERVMLEVSVLMLLSFLWFVRPGLANSGARQAQAGRQG